MPEPKVKPRHTPGRQMLHGSAWLVALRWAVRSMGVVSTIILARLLSPNDFGIVAIAMIVVGFFEMLSLTGQELAIIRHEAPTSEHYNTAWTISAGIGLGITVVLLLAAPLASQYFHDPRAVIVIRCLALRPLLSGIENVGLVEFQRSLRFDKIFIYNIYSKIASFVVTITFALFLRNYWALVIGILTGQVAKTFLSFALHPYKPKVAFSKYSELWSFSIWSFARAVGSYFVTQVDIIAIGGVAGSAEMGRYTVAKDVASSPIDELNEPVSAVLFPVMARYQSEPEKLRRLYLQTLGWAALIGSSTGVGVTLVSNDLVPIILGAKWNPITPLMGWLALTAGIAALTNSSFTVLDIVGVPHVGARMQWFRVGLLALILFPIAYMTHNLVRVAEARLLMTALFVPSLLAVAGGHVAVTVRESIAAIWRPVVASGVMAGVLWCLNNSFVMDSALRLPLDVVVGVASFSGALMGLWRLSGSPASPERDICGLLDAGRIKIAASLIRVSKTDQ